MKKFYSLLVMAVMAAVAFSAKAYTVTLTFDNPEAIASIEHLGTSYTPAEEVKIINENPDPATDYSVALITTNPGYIITGLTVTSYYTAEWMVPENCTVYDNVCPGEGFDGWIFSFTTAQVTAPELYSATVNVDGDPAKVSFQLSGKYTDIELSAGANTIEFYSNEVPFIISPATYGQALYMVSLNGVAQEKSYSTWYVNAADGDVIDIVTDFPDKDCAISFAFENEGTEGYVSEVRVNDATVENWLAGFTVKAGDNLAFTVDGSAYRLIDFMVNGESKNLYSMYSCTVVDDMAFTFDVTAYGTAIATINVDTPANIIYSIGYSDEKIVPTASTFTVEISEAEASYTPLNISAAAGAFIKSLTVDGEEATPSWDGSFCIYITDGTVINVETEALVRDQQAIFYFHNPDDSYDYNRGLNGYSFKSAINQDVDLKEGYNFIEFADAENPFTLQVNTGSEGANFIWLYFNDILLPSMEEYYPGWELELYDYDVVKLYISDGEPEQYGVAYDFGLIDDLPLIIKDYCRPVLYNGEDIEPLSIDEEFNATYGHYELPGTHITIYPTATCKISAVIVNGEHVDADEDGGFSFDVNDDTMVVVEGGMTGINGVTVNANADSRVYNLQGVEVKAENLPAGLYISDGKKFIVK